MKKKNNQQKSFHQSETFDEEMTALLLAASSGALDVLPLEQDAMRGCGGGGVGVSNLLVYTV